MGQVKAVGSSNYYNHITLSHGKAIQTGVCSNVNNSTHPKATKLYA